MFKSAQTPIHPSPLPMAYNNLTPKTRLGVGVAIIAWGGLGLYLSDKAEEKLGFTPTEEDKAELRNMTPKITTVDKSQR
ncbi:uncharacterized protein Triagg1_7236 [Trichoderma aggressivum f. europaeum]|uniref:Fatty acid activator Faa4 n=1 Tax=Trichoderma aggressivum f. europaeum TaxID=173218 RepID=A0AAE1I9Q0_9HYPO|nr:hypothetical protein Triagg1_7236 [Trichoderma aggressivum f. europaeum]